MCYLNTNVLEHITQAGIGDFVDFHLIYYLTETCLHWKSINWMSQISYSTRCPPGSPPGLLDSRANLKCVRRVCVMTQDATATLPRGDIAWMEHQDGRTLVIWSESMCVCKCVELFYSK